MAHGQLAGVLRHIRRLIGTSTDAEADGQLLQRFVTDRDEAAFAELVRRHGPMVLGLCRRILGDPHEADDAFQATFLVLVRKARSLDQWGSLGNWLYTVAYHLALKARATAARRRQQERQVEDMPQTAADDPVWRELRPLLDAEVNRLPAKYRAPVVLCYLEGKTNEEAARELGCPTGTLKCRLAQARELLRKRLTKRGLTASGTLLAPALAEQATAAVSPVLLETTIQTAALFAAGEAAAVGAISVRAVFLAQGALHTMFVHKLQTAAIVLAAFGLIGTGAGALFSRTSFSDTSEKRPPAGDLLAAAPAEAAPVRDAKPRPGERARQIRMKIRKEATLDEIPANTPLKDAIKLIEDRFKVALLVNTQAFNAIGVLKVEEQPVQLPKMTDVRLSTVLRRLMPQIEDSMYCGGAYLVRPDHIELTTTYNQWATAGADPKPPKGRPGSIYGVRGAAEPPEPDDESVTAPEIGYFGKLRRMTMVVSIDCEREPLVDALRELADDTGYDIVIDSRAAEKAKALVTLGLNNVWLDNAVNLLTEMADLDWYWMDKVVFVTTKENAKAHKENAKQAERAQAQMSSLTAKALGTSSEPRAITVNADKRPLGELLPEIARANHINLVLDPRVADKAKTEVTLTLNQVPVETAVRLLADVAGLRAVKVDSVFYVTSKENAAGLEKAPPGKTSKP